MTYNALTHSSQRATAHLSVRKPSLLSEVMLDPKADQTLPPLAITCINTFQHEQMIQLRMTLYKEPLDHTGPGEKGESTR